MCLSYSGIGNRHDNALAEFFFAMLKNEMYHRRRFPTCDAAKHAIIEFIEVVCNRRRPHSTIGYQIPANAMESFFERRKPESGQLHPIPLLYSPPEHDKRLSVAY